MTAARVPRYHPLYANKTVYDEIDATKMCSSCTSREDKYDTIRYDTIGEFNVD